MNPAKIVGLICLCWLVGCDSPDEVNCELTVSGVDVCIDLNSQKFCEKDLGGTATASEIEPGGPYAYCEDVYAVTCSGSIVETGENYVANHAFYANSEEDCATADGGDIVKP